MSCVSRNEPLFCGSICIRKHSAMPQRWERKFGAVFAKSLIGVPRVELYKDERDYDHGKNVKYLLLQNCITVRLVHDVKKDEYLLKLQMKDVQFSLMSDFSENLKLWQNAICLAAFQQQPYDASPSSVKPPANPSSVFQPQKAITAATSPDKPPFLNCDVSCDVRGTKVSLITTNGSEQLFTLNSTYFVVTGKDALSVSPEDKVTSEKICFDYSTIDWVGRGDEIFAFHQTTGCLFEFLCERADEVVSNLIKQMGLVPTPFRPEDLRLHYHKGFQPLGANYVYPTQAQRFRRTKSMELFKIKKRTENSSFARGKMSVTKSLLRRLSRLKSASGSVVGENERDAAERYAQRPQRPVTEYEPHYFEQLSSATTGRQYSLPPTPEKFRQSTGGFNVYHETMRPSLPQSPVPHFSQVQLQSQWDPKERPKSAYVTRSPMGDEPEQLSTYAKDRWRRATGETLGATSDSPTRNQLWERRPSHTASARTPVNGKDESLREARRGEVNTHMESAGSKTAKVSPMINLASYDTQQEPREKETDSYRESVMRSTSDYVVRSKADLPLNEQSLPYPIPVDEGNIVTKQKEHDTRNGKITKHDTYTEILTVDDATGRVGSKLINTFSTVYPKEAVQYSARPIRNIHKEMQEYERSYKVYHKQYEQISSQAKHDQAKCHNDVEDTWKNISLEKMLRGLENTYSEEQSPSSVPSANDGATTDV